MDLFKGTWRLDEYLSIEQMYKLIMLAKFAGFKAQGPESDKLTNEMSGMDKYPYFGACDGKYNRYAGMFEREIITYEYLLNQLQEIIKNQVNNH